MKKNMTIFLFSLLFILLLVLRFYEMEVYNPFGWDQTDNAWAAKNILFEHKTLLSGMVAKGNTGFHIGPLYYYLIAIVYWLTNLDPIASGIFAGITAAIGFFVLFFITKKLFTPLVALIAVFINTVASAGIMFDRVQWPVNFIPMLGLAVFYSLYKIVTGNEKYILILAALVGFSFHIHFTAVFFPIIILLTLPFFPRTKKALVNFLLGLLILGVFFIPTIINEVQSKSSDASHMTSYISSSYHGFHLRRVIQLTGDAFIQFEPFFFFPSIKLLKYILLPLLTFLLCYKKRSRKNILFCYLLWIFFIVPWFVFSTYSGELTDYYFSINRFIALVVISYLLYRIFVLKTIIPKIAIVVALLFYGYLNVIQYFEHGKNGLVEHREKVQTAIGHGEVIQFYEGVPESYIYWLETHKKK